MALIKAKESELYEEDARRLIKAITKFEENDENFEPCLKFAMQTLLFHNFLDADESKVKRSVSGLHEKYLIHAELQKAKSLDSLSQQLYEIFDSSLENKRGYGILSLILLLTNTSHLVHTLDLQETELEPEEKIDWAAYLNEGEENYDPPSEDSEIFTSDDESPEEYGGNFLAPQHPPRDDSGLGISPDSISGTSPKLFRVNEFTPESPPAPMKWLIERQTKNRDYLYWIPRYQKSFVESRYSLKHINFSKVWEEHLIKRNPYITLPKKVIIHERNVTKEVLWMLNGVKDLFVFNWDEQNYVPNAAIHLCNLTSVTLNNILKSLCAYGTKTVEICHFADEELHGMDMKFGQTCMTFQGYAWGLKQQMQEFFDYYYKLETVLKKKNEVFTLLVLFERVKSQLDELDIIYNIHQEVVSKTSNSCEPFERSVRLLNILWKHLSQRGTWLSSTSIMKKILKLFLKSCYPYFVYLEQLMIHGQVVDKYEEFIVYRKQSIATSDDDFWENGFCMRLLPSDVEEEFFLKTFLHDILTAGKSIKILQHINSLFQEESFRLYYEKDDLFLLFVNCLHSYFKFEKLKNKKKSRAKKHTDKTEVNAHILKTDDSKRLNEKFKLNKIIHHDKSVEVPIQNMKNLKNNITKNFLRNNNVSQLNVLNTKDDKFEEENLENYESSSKVNKFTEHTIKIDNEMMFGASKYGSTEAQINAKRTKLIRSQSESCIPEIFQGHTESEKSENVEHTCKPSPLRHANSESIITSELRKFEFVAENTSQKSKNDVTVTEKLQAETIKDPLLEQKIFEFNPETEKYFCPKVNPAYVVIEERPLEVLYTSKQEKIESIIENLEPHILEPINLCIIKAVSNCVKFAYYPTCKKLMTAFNENHNLMMHMMAMQKYFLMEAGDLMFSFYSKLFEKILYHEPWQDVAFLYSSLQNALSDDNENCERLHIFIDRDHKDIQSNAPLSILNSLQLSYEVEWPISIMLGTKVQHQYCEIFNLLLQIKCAKFLLDELHYTDLCKELEMGSLNKLMKLLYKSEFPKRQKVHGMYIMRMRLMFFVNGFHNYIMTRILHSFGMEFSTKLQSAATLGEMIEIHELYLKSLHERCLLNPRLPYLKDQIFRVLNLTYAFREMWQKGVSNLSLEDLQKMEKEFSECNNFLSVYLSRILKRGSYPHLESLMNLMLCETHSLHVFENRNKS